MQIDNFILTAKIEIACTSLTASPISFDDVLCTIDTYVTGAVVLLPIPQQRVLLIPPVPVSTSVQHQRPAVPVATSVAQNLNCALLIQILHSHVIAVLEEIRAVFPT